MLGSHTLTHLAIGHKATVRSVEAQGLIRRRLLDLGLVPGTTVEAIRHSPIGDPTAFLIRGSVIALRASEANLINIR